MKKPIGLPIHGAADNSTFFHQAPMVAPPSRLKNFRTFVPTKDRPQGGQRPGINKAYPLTQMGGGAPVQAMGVVSRAKTGTGLTISGAATIDGTLGRTGPSEAPAGQVWGLRNNFGMFLRRYENVTATSPDFIGDHGPPDESVVAVAISPNGNRVIYASNYVDTSTFFLVSRITCIDARTGVVYWTHRITRVSDPGNNAFTNRICCTAAYCFVATNQYVRVLRMNDGSQIGTDFNCNGWAEEVVDVCLTWDGTALLVAFNGSSVAHQNGYPGPNPYQLLNSGVKVRNGKWAMHFRTGVMKCAIQPFGVVPPIYGVPLSTQLLVGDRYYDGPVPYNPHNYCRLSEQLVRRPCGALIAAIAATPDGGFVVAHTNCGWGPNNDYVGVPLDSPLPTALTQQTDTISKFSSAGNRQWSSSALSITSLAGDSDAVHPAGAGPLYNDIPAGPAPGAGDRNFTSVMCIAVGNDGTIFAAGRRDPTGGYDAVAIRPDSLGRSGLTIWVQDLGATMLENGLAVGGDDGNPIICGERNSAWAGAGGVAAHLWKLDKNTGGVVGTFDLGAANISGLGVASKPSGEIFYVTDKV